MRRDGAASPPETALPLDRPAAWSTDLGSGRSAGALRPVGDGNSALTKGRMTSNRASARRFGRRSVRVLVESLSARDLAVLRSIAEHRFLGTRHIEALQFHDHATALSGARSARRVLRRLNDHGLLQHLQRRIGGIRAGSAGYIWTLGSVGVRVLAELDGATAPGRYREPSLRLLNHCLAIGEVHVELVDASRAGHYELVTVQLEPASWRRFLGFGGETRLVRPDLAVVTALDDYEDHWFLEVDLGSEHPPTVVRKCRLYLDYQASGQEQTALGVFPRVVWVVSDPSRAQRLRTALRQARLDGALFKVTRPGELTDLLARGAS